MFAQAVPPALQGLRQAQHLARLAGDEMLAARLHPGMFDCADQLRTVASFALRATFPLTEKPMPELPEGDPLGVLGFAEDALRGLQEVDFAGAAARRITHQAGFAELDQSASDYLHLFALPNLWFHLTTAFAILRKEDAAVGKADFDGLHSYPPGFSWED